jgi:hypothetical protein
VTQPHYADDACACGCDGTPAPGRRFITHHNLRVMSTRTQEHRASISASARRAWETKRQRMPLGSRRLDAAGYWLIKVREHGGRWDKEHVLVAEQAAGRKLSDDECVHHVNGVKTDNRPENLHICTRSDHSLIHGTFGALLPELMQRGVVDFDPSSGRYRLA